ncbi:trehalose 6-phosphatase [Breoghania corrubedonensis]|uniref:Trehalose 6-phosphate phosphatase n=1 Tax=Breoghania corrubedonensis TaxID=665038 RepID=A0A2T5V6N5_9HYPH|nr:trehalose-phosphatase [Breoghania corrubedonensis]PTW59411.1 trehalose 6-phosphatase [Breoghania corrubedonensis]
MTPPPPLSCRHALFLDFDGTLVDIAETPEGIRVPEGLGALLTRVADRLDGALAVVSGRPLSDIDALLKPLRLPAAGLHGLEHRATIGAAVERVAPPPELDILRRRIDAAGLIGEGVRLEDKGLAIAIHYRRAPERGPALAAALTKACADLSGLHMLHGKMVLEIKSQGHDKGVAVTTFLNEPVFAGRVPVFVGDDVTDEDGFRAVLSAGGFAVKVGAGETAAAHRLADVAAVHAWLDAFAAARACA